MQPDTRVNILLVDDYPENLLALESVLEGLGENVVKATSGEEALRCLLNQDFAVILLDVQMPGIDGFETATLIRSRARSRQTPIIFLTAFSTSEQLMFKGYSLGAVDYLNKPIDPVILTSKVTVFVDLFKKAEALKQQTEEVQRQATQLKSINNELRQSEERFRLLSACSPLGIFVTDIAGTCTYANPRCQAICGFAPNDRLSEVLLRSVHTDDRDRVEEGWRAYINEGQEYSDEFRLLFNNTTRWVSVRSSPMLSDRSEPLGHVGTIEDITERKQAEADRSQIIIEKVARREAEAASRMKDEFLAVLSHELRTPLNSMLGWSRLLRTKKFDEATTARALETIERNATTQAQLIEDILDVSQIIRGKLKLSCGLINLVSVVESATEAVRPSADAKTIQLTTILEPSPIHTWGDPVRLQQVVWNLLTNAIKFTSEDGKVEICLSLASDQPLEVTGDEALVSGYGVLMAHGEALGVNDGASAIDNQLTTHHPLPNIQHPPSTPNTHQTSYAEIRVSDTGVGISPEFLPNVFDRFRQADSTTTRSHNGLGLGLAIVRHLVELHGGSVRAESLGEGLGATFTVRLPIREGEPYAQDGTLAEDGKLTPPSPHALQSVKVLIVDDEADAREFLTFTLRQYGAITAAAASVDAALETINHFNPDVLVSDIGMPEKDGYVLIRKLRELTLSSSDQLPAVALTAYSSEEDRNQALSAGFQVHLSKPVEMTALVKAIAQLLNA